MNPTYDRTPDDPWSVAEQAFPAGASPSEQLRFLVNYAVLAPSGHNTQPWLFRVTDQDLELYADRRRALPVIDPEDRQLIMSCGAALFHLRTAIRHYGFDPVVRTLPDPDDPDLLAFVRLGPADEPTLAEHSLFQAIKRRRTNRLAFKNKPVDDDALRQLQQIAAAESAHLHVVASAEQRNALADLIADGDRRQGADRRFRRELAAWLHPNRSSSRDGIPGYAQGMKDLASYAGPLLVRSFDWGNGQAARNRELAEGSPLMLVLTTEGDDTPAWLKGGQALSAVLLLAAQYDLSASFLNQPIELPEMRQRVVERLGLNGHPQVILRMGYGLDLPPTPRRPVTDVLIKYAK